MRFVQDQRTGLLLPNRRVQRGFFAMGPGFFAKKAGGGATAARIAAVIGAGDGTNFDHSKILPSFNVTAGALIVVKLGTLNSGVVSGIIDTAGNTDWTRAVNWNSNTIGEIWYCLSSLAKTGNVLTVSFNNGNQYYGLTAEAYSGGTFALDAANSGTAAGAYVATPLASGSISAAKGSLIASGFTQYNETLPSTTASQSQGNVVNSASIGGTVVMASGEIIPSAAFSGTFNVSINQSPAVNTKLDLGWATFTCT